MSSLKVHELNLYLVRRGIAFELKKPEKVAYVKYISLAGSCQALWRKRLCEKSLTSGSESDEEERIVGSEALSTSSRELSDISDSPVLHTVDTSTSRYGRKRTRVVRRPRQLRAMAEQEEKRKKE